MTKRAATAVLALSTAFMTGAVVGPSVQPDAPSDESRIELLERIAEIHEQRWQAAQVRRNEITREELTSAHISALESKARLAAARHDTEALRKAHDAIVEVLTERLDRARAYYDSGRISALKVDECEVELLEAKLARLESLGE